MIRIEAYLDGEGLWWTMPYRFDSVSDGEGFMATLAERNPGRSFRIAA